MSKRNQCLGDMQECQLDVSKIKRGSSKIERRKSTAAVAARLASQSYLSSHDPTHLVSLNVVYIVVLLYPWGIVGFCIFIPTVVLIPVCNPTKPHPPNIPKCPWVSQPMHVPSLSKPCESHSRTNSTIFICNIE